MPSLSIFSVPYIIPQKQIKVNLVKKYKKIVYIKKDAKLDTLNINKYNINK